MTTLHLRNSIDRSPLRLGLPRVQPIWIIRGFLLIPLALVCFALSSTARAQLSPAPDGGYPGYNTAEGDMALFSLTTGRYNTATGFAALQSNTNGFANTATGYDALYFNTGSDNTATGAGALTRNTTGSQNTATGVDALDSNDTGKDNTATGDSALGDNIAGSQNTATGSSALFNNTTMGFERGTASGNNNTATGYQALYANTIGSGNTANGVNALYTNDDGTKNTATGNFSLYNSVSGGANTADGYQALYNNTGSDNTGLGYNAGYNLTTGSGNVCIGQGVLGVAGESNTTRIRNVYSSVASGRAVYVNSNNKIGTLVSSRRFKDEIKPMNKASEAILALKPVTFRYKKEIEPNGAIMFGLIAEEVEKVDPDLITRDAKGEAETVRYEAVNAMLLNEFLKEHRKNEEQEATIARQQKQIEALAAGLQKMSAQLEVNKFATGRIRGGGPAPQIVDNDR